ncbi:hypothetical protein NFX46_07410 [Streptomyces phaeoluteigriseus]|uniref:Integral membrane protein n=1 Tax=Streptomyces phaeoluteigriseus TaxID=114686 RepID=A0ABY4Z3Z7_9ACTN|nr:hypothetical protein [Streptomyces phaeoluteigriseus]USQ83631.1 hypothetical protein NFX46_07410 [Streptomyces phaeoluteigriseus]
MGTKTVDEAGAETGAEAAEAQRDEKAVDVTKTDAQDEVTPASEDADGVDDSEDSEEGEVVDVVEDSRPSGVGLGAGAVVSAALGLVSLSGGWIGTVASARQTLVGQLETSSTASVANQIQAVYGDAWQTTALWAGLFALAALVTGVVVLARPAFGTPGRVQAPWIKSVAWAGVTLGVIGLLLAVLKYTDALLGLPSAG